MFEVNVQSVAVINSTVLFPTVYEKYVKTREIDFQEEVSLKCEYMYLSYDFVFK